MEERLLEILGKEYDNIKPIGNGAYGFVYKGEIKNKKELRAIKVMDLN